MYYITPITENPNVTKQIKVIVENTYQKDTFLLRQIKSSKKKAYMHNHQKDTYGITHYRYTFWILLSCTQY